MPPKNVLHLCRDKKDKFSRRAAGYHFKQKKSESGPKSDSVSVFYFSD